MEETGEVRRIRLIFEEAEMLNKKHRVEGLEHCWMILKPHLRTIADVAVDISFTFHLHNACPHGLLLSMDGFTLPSFQPTCILKDKDIISVSRKREATSRNVFLDRFNSIKGSETLEEPVVVGGVKLLAIEEFEKESGGYQSEHDDYGTNSKDAGGTQIENQSKLKDLSRKKKRKSSEEICSLIQDRVEAVGEKHGNKRQKKRKRMSERDIGDNVEHDKNDSCKIMENYIGHCQSDTHKPVKRVKDKNVKLCSGNKGKKHKKSHHRSDHHRSEESSEREDKEETDDEKHDNKRHKKKDQRNDARNIVENKITENHYGYQQLDTHKSFKRIKHKKENDSYDSKELKSVENHHDSDGSSESEQEDARLNTMGEESGSSHNEKKGPSRSARRKKAKRHWRREQKARNEKDTQINENIVKENFPKDKFFTSPDKVNELKAEEETLPITVRPGHIRFVSFEEEELEDIQKQTSTFQWKGITNKRQGQNWGQQKNDSQRTKRPDSPREDVNMQLGTNPKLAFKKKSLVFEELSEITGFPKQDDVIAYRVVELSGTLSPELSDYRVGKVESSDEQSKMIRLVPVPEYPVGLDGSPDGEICEVPNFSIYNEDGSLEIEFASLVDPRLVHRQDTTLERSHLGNGMPFLEKSSAESSPKKDGITTNHEDGMNIISEMMINSNNITTPTNAKANNDMNLWEEIERAVNVKKAELAFKVNGVKSSDSQQKGSQTSSQGNHNKINDTSWSKSVKLARRSALGPVLSLLREQKVLE